MLKPSLGAGNSASSSAFSAASSFGGTSAAVSALGVSVTGSSASCAHRVADTPSVRPTINRTAHTRGLNSILISTSTYADRRTEKSPACRVDSDTRRAGRKRKRETKNAHAASALCAHRDRLPIRGRKLEIETGARHSAPREARALTALNELPPPRSSGRTASGTNRARTSHGLLRCATSI